jgi:dolichyl-diphosphooligosaccharide--protein glycosyltransferase
MRWVALAFVAAVRLLPFPAVYRGGNVVLSSNDPYLYRHLVARVTEAAASPLDLPTLLGAPPVSSSGEPLLVATLAVVGEVFGGGDWVVGTTLAWYPVVSALATAVVVYALATFLSGDRRVGVAAVALFAVVPGHAFRTGLGFADHHAFDYPLLAVTACSFVALVTRDVAWPWEPRTVALAGVLAVGTAGQVLAWEAGPLLLVPLAVGIALAGPLAVAHDRVAALGPVVAGLAAGGALALAAHAALGWQSLAVAVVPALVAAGAAAVLAGAAVLARLDRSPVLLVGAELAGLALLAGVAGTAAPELVAALERGVAFLTRSTAIGEMQSLLDRWGPIFGPLVMLGFTPFLAIPAMGWSLWQVDRERVGWLLLSPYAWTFFALSLVQRRFTGELAAFVAVFGALGLLALVGWLDLARAPGLGREGRQRAGANERSGAPVAEADGGAPDKAEGDPALSDRVRVGMVGSLAAVLLGFPALFSAEIHTRLTIDSRKHAAARWMARYADARDWSYPRSYVFSEWGRNRMYNHFVSGESESYTFARRNYGSFIRASDPVAWYEELRGRVGFVVTTGEAGAGFLTRMQGRLHDAMGSRVGNTPGLAHYRAVYASEDGFVKAFTLVPGATLEGSVDVTEPTVVPVRTEVSVGGASFTYERLARTDADGAFTVAVAHPGEYRVGDRRVTVPEAAVVDGGTVRVAE